MLVILLYLKVFPEKIVRLVDDISKLNLLEVADLNSLLKTRLNISDAPVMMAGAPAAASAPKEVSFLNTFLRKKFFSFFLNFLVFLEP